MNYALLHETLENCSGFPLSRNHQFPEKSYAFPVNYTNASIKDMAVKQTYVRKSIPVKKTRKKYIASNPHQNLNTLETCNRH